MAIEAKATLLNEMERALATEITAAEMARILTILSEKLDHYDIAVCQQDGILKDDLLDAYLSAHEAVEAGFADKIVTLDAFHRGAV